MILMLARLMVLMVLTAAWPARAETPLQKTRSTLEKWVETRQLISQTRGDWQADQDTLRQTIQLFEREWESLNEQLSKVSTNSRQVEIEQQKTAAEQKSLNDALAKAESLVAELEKRVIALTPVFPPPLLEKIQPLLKRIPAAAETRAGAVERMQNVVGILSEVDKFNGAVSVVSEIQKSPSGAEVQVETIYVGLGQAYFVDKTGDYAGTGVSTRTGWEWTPRAELAGKIQKSIASYKNAAPATFVSLPIQIK